MQVFHNPGRGKKEEPVENRYLAAGPNIFPQSATWLSTTLQSSGDPVKLLARNGFRMVSTNPESLLLLLLLSYVYLSILSEGEER